MSRIICISRQYATGGLEIGQKVAEALRIPCYDRELITKTAEEHQLNKNVVEEHDERAKRLLSFTGQGSLAAFSPYAGAPSAPLNDQVFYAQSDTIRRLADQGPCVFIGRCAGEVLQGQKKVSRIFIFADKAYRRQRAVSQYGCPPEKAEDILRRMDKQRAFYYNFYTSTEWGQIDSFDLAINSAASGIDGAVQTILAYINALDQ